MDEAAREALAERVLTFAGAASIEAIVTDVDAGLTRFTHNAVHQNVAHTDTSVRVRTIVDGRTGVAATNDLGDDALRATVDRARFMASLAPRDDDAPGLTKNERTAAPPGAYDPETANASPARRAGIVADICAVVERNALWAAGYVATERSGVTIANSAGTLVSFDGTSCALNVKANGPDSTGFAERFSTRIADVDGTAAGTVASAKAVRGRSPVTVEPGPWTVVLEPAAFGELLSYLSDHFSAQSFDEGSSFLCDGLERTYASANVSLADDYAHPLLAGMPFDFEGYRTERVPLLERGAAGRLVTDATWAKRLHRPNTGHGLPAPNAGGPLASHMVVAPGDTDATALIAGVERGLLITRFWYIRPVDARKTIVTGMTRDGTFLIERGEVTGGVRNMRFNQSIVEALGSAVFANACERTGGYAYSTVVPTVRLDDFTFSSGTEF
jgi:predicted Zn-dependent protease